MWPVWRVLSLGRDRVSQDCLAHALVYGWAPPSRLPPGLHGCRGPAASAV